MRFRIAVLGALTSLVLIGVVAPVATARPVQAPLRAAKPAALLKVPVRGRSNNGKLMKGTYFIHGYVVRNRRVYAVGTLTGVIKRRRFMRSGVMMPASLTGSGSSSGGATTAQGSCTILHLVLAPIRLNLLGLHVTLGGGTNGASPIVLDITAQQGPNNLLGNLLCSLTGLLNQGGALSQLSQNLQGLAATLTSLSSLLGSIGL